MRFPPTNPPQAPPANIPPGWTIPSRSKSVASLPEMVSKWILGNYNEFNQPIDPSTMKPGIGEETSHIPLPRFPYGQPPSPPTVDPPVFVMPAPSSDPASFRHAAGRRRFADRC